MFSICVVWRLVRLTIANLTQVGQNESKKRFVGGEGLRWWGSFPLRMFVFLFPIWSARRPVLSELPFMNPAVRLPEYMTQDFSQLSLRAVCCPCCLLVRSFFSKVILFCECMLL